MKVMILLIVFSLLLATGFLVAFIWSVRDGQMEDDYTPSVRMLFDTAPSIQVKHDSEPELQTPANTKEDL